MITLLGRNARLHPATAALFPTVAASLVVLVVAVAGGCGTSAAEREPPVDLPSSFSRSGADLLPDRWWTAFGDAELDTVVEAALAANLDLKAAWERLQAARAATDIVRAAHWPSLDAEAEAGIRRRDGGGDDGDGDGDGFNGAVGEDDVWYRAGLAASYEVDLWGRLGSAAAAERFRARATLADYRTVAVSLSAEVAGAWYGLHEARRQRELVAAQVATNEQALALLRARFGRGLVRRVDILRQRQLVAATREQAHLADARVDVAAHRLAVLLGRPPRAPLDTLAADLPAPPPLPATGVPLDLVRRRPDVRRAFALLQAADRDLATAVSNRYPRLSVTASVSTEADEPARLVEDWARSLVGNLLAPVFRGGELSAEVDRARARTRQRLHEYGQAVLAALRDVEDALARERAQARRLDSLARQVELAGEAHARLRLEYFNGAADYLDVLTARTDVQRLRRDLLAARLILLEDRIALYRALAGGVAPPEGDPDDDQNRAARVADDPRG